MGVPLSWCTFKWIKTFIFGISPISPDLCVSSMEPTNRKQCGELENIQERATKFILALRFETDTRYKSR